MIKPKSQQKKDDGKDTKQGQTSKDKENVVDADFEEVKEDKEDKKDKDKDKEKRA